MPKTSRSKTDRRLRGRLRECSFFPFVPKRNCVSMRKTIKKYVRGRNLRERKKKKLLRTFLVIDMYTYPWHSRVVQRMYTKYSQLAEQETRRTHLNELYRDRRFPDTTTTDDDELVSLRVALSIRGFRHLLPSRLGFTQVCIQKLLALAPHARLNAHLARTRVVTDGTPIMGSKRNRRRRRRRRLRRNVYVRVRMYVYVYMILTSRGLSRTFFRGVAKSQGWDPPSHPYRSGSLESPRSRDRARETFYGWVSTRRERRQFARHPREALRFQAGLRRAGGKSLDSSFSLEKKLQEIKASDRIIESSTYFVTYVSPRKLSKRVTDYIHDYRFLFLCHLIFFFYFLLR